MTISISDYTDVSARALDLGCSAPNGMALLPECFDTALRIDDLRHRSEAATVKALFRMNGIPLDDLLPGSAQIPYIQNNSFEWVAPTLFISSALMSADPTAVSIALGVLANYLTDFFKGMAGTRVAKLHIVVQRRSGGTYRRVTYEGSPEGLRHLAEIIQETADE